MHCEELTVDSCVPQASTSKAERIKGLFHFAHIFSLFGMFKDSFEVVHVVCTQLYLLEIDL